MVYWLWYEQERNEKNYYFNPFKEEISSGIERCISLLKIKRIEILKTHSNARSNRISTLKTKFKFHVISHQETSQ